MNFVSLQYVFFFLVVSVSFYFLPHRHQWKWLLAASLLFYMAGGPWHIIVPLFIGLVGYGAGLLIERTQSPAFRKTVLIASLVANIGVLTFFKYLAFLTDSLLAVSNFIRGHLFASKDLFAAPWVTQILVPLGISYVTFQSIGYVIEIYRGSRSAERHMGFFFTYLLFFPKLFAGPIERAHNFLPQLRERRPFDLARVKEGLKLIAWGLFKKLVIAQQIAKITNVVFSQPDGYIGLPVVLAVLFFTVQLYADFSGYTDIAIGSANVLGYQLMKNFDFPFIARSTTELWRRWHISLSTWFFDYVYNPLAIAKRDWDKWAVVYASLLTFLILGLWHGASWKFVMLGFLQGVALSVEFLTRRLRKEIGRKLPEAVNDCLGVVCTFSFFSFALIFLKAATFADALKIVKHLFISSGGEGQTSVLFAVYSVPELLMAIFVISFLFVVEYVDRNFWQFSREGRMHYLMVFRKNWVMRTAVYALMAYLFVGLGMMKPEQFIYFQF